MGVTIGIILQVIGSFLFAGGAALQRLGVVGVTDDDGSSDGLSLRGMLQLLLKPRWLLGLLCVGGGAALNLVALTMAPLTVVQPIGVLAVVWSILLGAKLESTPITRRAGTAALLTILGLAGFTILSARSTTDHDEFHFEMIIGAVVVVCILAGLMALVATRMKNWLQPILWASVGAMFYGLATGLMKSAINLVRDRGHAFYSLEILALAALIGLAYGVGVWMINRGYATGPAAVTVGTMTTVDPVIAVSFGLIVLGEGTHVDPLTAVLMISGGVVAILGIILLSRDQEDNASRPSEPTPVADPERS